MGYSVVCFMVLSIYTAVNLSNTKRYTARNTIDYMLTWVKGIVKVWIWDKVSNKKSRPKAA